MKRLLLYVAIALLVHSSPSNGEIDRKFFWSDEAIDRFYGDAAGDRGAAAQHESLRKLKDLARNPGQESPDQVVLHLGEGLRKLTRKNIFQVRERIHVYDLVQSTLLSIPGHAKYFADEIKREQKEVGEKEATGSGDRIAYNRNRWKYFNTMGNLPSPETIAVLGDFLSDDIDTPRIKMSPDSDWGENPRANSFASTITLSVIGLREPPATTKSYDADPEAHLAKSRAWWEEVKSGRKTFSLVGQKMEYRFKPDGTWETIPIANPPDDGPEAGRADDTKRREKEREVQRGDSSRSTRGGTLWLYVVSGLGLLILGVWFWRKK